MFKRRIQFNLNNFLAQRFWESRNYQITSYVVSTPRSSWWLRFYSNDIHRPVSTQDFEFITKLESSNYEFVNKPVESSLSVCSML